MSRRDALRRIGYAAAIALPAVAMLSFPNGAIASTCSASQCGGISADCAGQFCCRIAPGVYQCQAGPCTGSCT